MSLNPKERWLDRFLEFLRPLDRQGDIDLCSDQQIKISEDWHKRIEAQIRGAKAVVLLVSPAFLASDYIANCELPIILKKATGHGVRFRTKGGPNALNLVATIACQPKPNGRQGRYR